MKSYEIGGAQKMEIRVSFVRFSWSHISYDDPGLQQQVLSFYHGVGVDDLKRVDRIAAKKLLVSFPLKVAS